MKRLLFVAITIASLTGVSESLYIPKYNTSNSNYILKNGEIVYNVVDDIYASMIIGNNTRCPYYVSDEYALKCENICRTLDSTELTIQKSDNVTYDNGTYLINNESTIRGKEGYLIATFTITAPVGYILDKINYDTAFIDMEEEHSVGVGRHADISVKFDNNVAYMTVITKNATKNKYWNFTALTKNNTKNNINNTTEPGKDFVIIDNGYTTEGHGKASAGSKYKLSDLRSWVANLYNGDRGRHWANYDACNDICVGNHVIKWRKGSTNLSGIRDEGNKISWMYEGKRSLYLTQTVQDAVTEDYSDANIRITSIDAVSKSSSNVCEIAFTYEDIPSADVTKWKTKYSYDVKGGGSWLDMTPTVVSNEVRTSSSGYVVIHVPLATSSGSIRGFWKIVYNSDITSVASSESITYHKVTPQVVVDKADLIVTSKVVLKSPAGKYFAIKVSDSGVLSTEEYTDIIIEDEK